MRLRELLDGIERIPCDAWAETEVQGIQEDSRQVQPGDLFVAIQGLTVDGHAFAHQAVQAGAVAVVAGRELDVEVPCLVVENPARTLALIAARFAGEPALRMELMGITGTNGKTTTTYIIEAILEAAGHSPGVIGTVAYRYGGSQEKARFTTPTPLMLQGVLSRMASQGCSHAVMEVSSHALQLERIWGCAFRVAAFTHLTQDHLDLHGTMEAYLEAKLRLFAHHLRSGGVAVINVDGAGAERVVEVVHKRGDLKLIRCSATDPQADAALVEPRYSMDGLGALLRIGQQEVEIRSRLIGTYNGDNILLAAACCHAVGVDPATVARGVARVDGIPGRLERVDAGREFAVLVDYAHTPDALVRSMEVLRPICSGRLIVVFGCGGDRDRGKRPLMGQAVARGADLAVVTSDNPRTEEPLAIIEAILGGIRSESLIRLDSLDAERGYLVQPDRRQAIACAVQAARPGDIVLIAGKGHEDYQILGDRRIHFDDREEARRALERR